MQLDEIAAQRKPTLLELQNAIQEKQSTIYQLQLENEQLMGQLNSMKKQLEIQNQQYIQKTKDLVGDENEDAPIERSQKPREILLNRWAIPFVVNTTLVVIGILCSPGIREDYVELGQAIHAGIAVLEGAISEVTAATVFPEIGTSLILSLMIATASIVAVLLLKWFIQGIRSHYNMPMKITIAAFPVLPIVLSAAGDTFQSLNSILVMIVMQAASIALQVRPKEKKLKLKRPKRK